MSSVLQIKNVTKRFGAATAVDSLSLDVGAGEFLAIMGSSGSGKSTLLRMIAGLEQPSEGDILLNDVSTRGLAAHERDTPMVWQSLALFPFLNVLENVEFGLKMRGVAPAERRKRAMTWLERLEIERFAKRAITELSGGQRQRVALARSLVTEPPVLLLDEPLSALDAHLTMRMQSVLSGLQRELGITFVYVTHSHSEAFSMSDRVVIMSEGRIQQIGTPRDLYLRPVSRFVAEFLGANNIFSGEVREDHQGEKVLTTEDGPIRLPERAYSRALGERIELVVSSDRLVLTDGEAPNRLSGRLIGEEFIGAGVNLFLETGSGREIIIQVPQRELNDLSLTPGRSLTVGWLPDDGHVIESDDRFRHVS
ncbi:MAG: ABC transporter ATP-binding protein [Phyllobacteriaceae bacterium]|nr:ABC transporter ATP-binding protein [Phyllobacteriaceae bacterium]